MLGTGSQAQGVTGNGNDTLTQEEKDRMLALSLAQGDQASATTSFGRARTPSNMLKQGQIMSNILGTELKQKQ